MTGTTSLGVSDGAEAQGLNGSKSFTYGGFGAAVPGPNDTVRAWDGRVCGGREGIAGSFFLAGVALDSLFAGLAVN